MSIFNIIEIIVCTYYILGFLGFIKEELVGSRRITIGDIVVCIFAGIFPAYQAKGLGWVLGTIFKKLGWLMDITIWEKKP